MNIPDNIPNPPRPAPDLEPRTILHLFIRNNHRLDDSGDCEGCGYPAHVVFDHPCPA